MMILWVVLAGVILFLVSSMYHYLNEKIHPFTYRGIPLLGLREHFWELYLRGFSRTRMVVTEEGSGLTFQVRKSWPLGTDDIRLHVIASAISRIAPRADDLMKRWSVLGFESGFGVFDLTVVLGIRRRFFPDNPTCLCGDDIDKVMEAVSVLVTDGYGLGEDARFSVRVEGSISPWDHTGRPICTGTQNSKDVFVIPILGLTTVGKPYKRYQAKAYRRRQRGGGLAVQVGRFFGTIWYGLKRLLFGRGPDDDLMGK